MEYLMSYEAVLDIQDSFSKKVVYFPQKLLNQIRIMLIADLFVKF